MCANPSEPAEPDYQPVLDVRSKFNPDLFEKVCQAVEQGNSIRKSCEMFKVPFATFYDWNDKCTDSERFTRAKLALARQEFARIGDLSAKLANFEAHVPADPKLASAWVNALDKAARLKLEVAKRLNQAEYGDKSESLTRVESVSYVISLDPTETAKPETVEVTQVKTIPPPGDAPQLPVIPPKPRLKRAKRVKVEEAKSEGKAKPKLEAKREAKRKVKK